MWMRWVYICVSILENNRQFKGESMVESYVHIKISKWLLTFKNYFRYIVMFGSLWTGLLRIPTGSWGVGVAAIWYNEALSCVDWLDQKQTSDSRPARYILSPRNWSLERKSATVWAGLKLGTYELSDWRDREVCAETEVRAVKRPEKRTEGEKNTTLEQSSWLASAGFLILFLFDPSWDPASPYLLGHH